jgi:sepiapterin reductase
MILVIITGATRGFGKEIALSFLKEPSELIQFVLTGRSTSDLVQIKQDIESKQNHSVPCIIHSLNLSNIHELLESSNSLFESFNRNKYSKAILINNAGSLGPLESIGNRSTVLHEMQEAFDLNIKSSCFLSSEFVRRYTKHLIESKHKLNFKYLIFRFWKDLSIDSCQNGVIVNVSSLAAIQAFPSWGLYCAGKAAREMFHKVIAEEQIKKTREYFETTQINKKILVLNYAPGPMDTDMQKQIREGELVDNETREYFINAKKMNQLVSASVSADKLVKLVLSELFESGAHIDFFDPIAGIDA